MAPINSYQWLAKHQSASIHATCKLTSCSKGCVVTLLEQQANGVVKLSGLSEHADVLRETTRAVANGIDLLQQVRTVCSFRDCFSWPAIVNRPNLDGKRLALVSRPL